MRICLLVDCYLPVPKSTCQLIHDLALEFRRLGHQVIIATLAEDVPADLAVTVEEDITVARVRTRGIKGVSRPLRAWRETQISRLMWSRAHDFFAQHPCDLLVFYSPSIFFGALVRKLKRLWRCPAYLVLRDIFPQWALEAGLLRKGPVYSFFRHYEVCQYEAADVIGVESRGSLQYFDRDFPGRFLTEVLPNWSSVPEIAKRSGALRRRLGLGGEVIFAYGGNIGVAQDPDNLLRLARRLQVLPGAALVFIGQGSEAPRIEAAIRAEGLTHVHLLGPVEQSLYLELLADADVGLVSLDRHLTSHNLPGKLLGYAAAGLPILASINPHNDLHAILKETGAGLSCTNADDDCLYQAAVRLAEDAELRRTMSSASRQLLETHFSARAAAATILQAVSPSAG
jgi:glycosyltransferase involved in cell wall biosynthesis